MSSTTALQLTRSVGKFLYSVNPTKVEETSLLRIDAIDPYLSQEGMGASGVLHHILAHKAAVHFMALAVSYC